MEYPNKIQVLATATTELQGSQTRMNLVSLCLKAQQGMTNKLRQENERRKERCNFIQNTNIQLKAEIKNAEQEIKRSQRNYETIRSANMQLKKELLLTKKNNMQLTEHMKQEEKKFENLWLECKSRYEGIPFVQKLMQATKKADTLKKELVALDKETENLNAEIKKKEHMLSEFERKQIIQLAEYMINELPAKLKAIKENSAEINELNAEIKKIKNEQNIKHGQTPDKGSAIAKVNAQQPTETAMVVDDNWPNLSKNADDLMPRLELESEEMDVLSVKLELKKTITAQSKTQIKSQDYVTDLGKNLNKPFEIQKSVILNKEEFISPYFKKSTITITSIEDTEDNKTVDYSKKKLINILKDVQLDDSETYNILSTINTDDLQEVEVISSDISKKTIVSKASPESKDDADNEEIEVIDITKSNNDIIFPPTQFLDMTQEKVIRSSEHDMQVILEVSLVEEPSSSKNIISQPKSSQEVKKKVSFDMPMTIHEIANDSVEQSETPNQTLTIQMEEDVATDENYKKIKEMMLKKRNLDLSPQFIYAKNPILQKKNENENIVTSKFFGQPKHTDIEEITQTDEAIINVREVEVKEPTKPIAESSNKAHANMMDVDEPVTSPKSKETKKTVKGLLFKHGPQGLPESLDVSMSTTGFDDDDDPESSHCLNNSLLLSPKADDQIPGYQSNTEIGSQEIPYFLTGFRKSVSSFFGHKSASDTNNENVEQNQENNFNFNFGGQEKKSRGGIFSFFK